MAPPDSVRYGPQKMSAWAKAFKASVDADPEAFKANMRALDAEIEAYDQQERLTRQGSDMATAKTPLSPSPLANDETAETANETAVAGPSQPQQNALASVAKAPKYDHPGPSNRPVSGYVRTSTASTGDGSRPLLKVERKRKSPNSPTAETSPIRKVQKLARKEVDDEE